MDPNPYESPPSKRSPEPWWGKLREKVAEYGSMVFASGNMPDRTQLAEGALGVALLIQVTVMVVTIVPDTLLKVLTLGGLASCVGLVGRSWKIRARGLLFAILFGSQFALVYDRGRFLRYLFGWVSDS